jgi:hypothetical protein
MTVDDGSAMEIEEESDDSEEKITTITTDDEEAVVEDAIVDAEEDAANLTSEESAVTPVPEPEAVETEATETKAPTDGPTVSTQAPETKSNDVEVSDLVSEATTGSVVTGDNLMTGDPTELPITDSAEE